MSLAGGDELFEHAAAGLLVTTADGTIHRANATFCRWLGHSAEELVGRRRVQDLFTMGGRVFHQTHWAPLLQMQGSVAEVKLDMVHRDGHHVPLLLSAIRHQQGERVCHHLAVMVVNDRHKYEAELVRARKGAEAALTARQDAEAALRQVNEQLSRADRRKDEFLATLAHELRNPLAPMRNVVALLKLKNLADPHLQWSRDVLERQVQQLTHLVDDLLEVSRITQGKLELRRQPVDLASAMEAAVEAAEPAVLAASHRLSIQWPDPPITLNADPTRLTQILQNLLNNAAKYTPPGGQLWLSAQRDGDHVVLSVRDTGIGIPQEHLSNIFEMFSQLAPALERSQGGLGIGLALVQGLVELHGGTITARSAGAGQGSEFVVRLPASSANASSLGDPAPATAPAAEQRGQSILVVDDNDDAAQSLEILLGLRGHAVAVARDGHQALYLAALLIPQVVLLDIGLPQLNGYEVARLIRQQAWGQNMLLVALTGWGQAQDKQAAKDAGFDRHLTKPVDMATLETILDELRPA
ncbi:MAG: response regulator [Rubrivivax sp.]|nr:MAG: response regulator [Rubrivivax sp.]